MRDSLSFCSVSCVTLTLPSFQTGGTSQTAQAHLSPDSCRRLSRPSHVITTLVISLVTNDSWSESEEALTYCATSEPQLVGDELHRIWVRSSFVVGRTCLCVMFF